MKRKTGAWVLAAALALSAALPAAAENVIQINGEETPLTRVETLQMVQEATEAFYGDEALKAELADEIREEVLYLGNEGEEPVGENPVFDETVREITTEEFHLETREVPDSAVEYVSRFTRNPIPPIVEWDLGTRAPLREMQSFYWLRADPSG